MSAARQLFPMADCCGSNASPESNTGCVMKQCSLFLLLSMLCATASMAGPDRSTPGSSSIDLTQWTPPNIAAVGDDPFGALVKYGYALFTDTANEIGPTASDATRRFAGKILRAKTVI